MAALSLTNPVMRNFIFYGSILGAKMLAMSLLTGSQRFKKNVSKQKYEEIHHK